MALLSSASTIAGLVDEMINAADALMKHQGQAAKVRTKATRTTCPPCPMAFGVAFGVAVSSERSKDHVSFEPPFVLA